MIPDDTSEPAPGASEQSACLEASSKRARRCIVHHAAGPEAANSFQPLAVHEQSGPSKPRNFKAKLYQQMEDIFEKVYSRKITCTCSAGNTNAKKHVLWCTQSTLDHHAKTYQWSVRNFRLQSSHEEASGLSWRNYQLSRAMDGQEQPFPQGQSQAPFPCRCSPVLKITELEERSHSIGPSSPSKVVTPSEVDHLIPGRAAHSDSGGKWIDFTFISQPVKFRSLPLGRRSLVSQTFPESTISLVVPRLNFAADYPTQSVKVKSATLIPKPQAIILAFSLSILLSLIIVVYCYVRGKRFERRKDSSRHRDIPNQPRLFSSSTREASHRVTIKAVPPSPPKLSRNTASNPRAVRSLPAHRDFGILHPIETSIASERMSDVTPPLDMPQGENEMDQHQDVAIHTSLRSRIVSLTASFSTPTASPTCQSADEASFPNCTETPPQGNLSCPRECNLKASGKSVSSLNGILQPIDFSGFERDMECESAEIPSSSTSMKERSATTASSMRRRSYIVADRLSSILRPSMSSGFSDSSSKPLPLRRLKTSYGIGDEFDSDEEQDQAALSRFLRMQYAEWQVEQLSRADGGLETDNCSSSVGFRAIEKQRRRSTVFSCMEPASLRSTKRGSFASMKAPKGAKGHLHSHFNYNPPSPHDFTPNSISPMSSYPVMHEPDQPTLANATSSSPNYPSKGKSRFTSVLLAQDAQFCASPKSLSSQSHTNIPPPADSPYEQTYEDPKELGQQQVPSTLAAYKKKHRHSKSAPMNIFRDSSIDLEPIEEIKLSVTNPDLDLNESETQRKPPVPLQNDMQPTQPISPTGVEETSSSAVDAHSPEDDESNLEETIDTDKIEAIEKYSMDTPQKTDDGETPSDSSKLSKRRSWLSSSLSLKILPGSPSKKAMALNMSPARLKKSLSIGGRMSAREMKAGLHPLDLEIPSPNNHDSHPGYANAAASPSIKDTTIPHPTDPQPSPKQHELCKSSSSSLTTLFGLFSKSKRSSNLLHQEFLGIASSPSPTSEFMSSTCSSYSGNHSLNLFELSKLNGSQGTRSSTTTAMHSPVMDGSNSIHTNPYGSARCSCDDIDHANSTCGRADHDAAQIRWKSRLNSVGSFIDELETINQTPQSGLVIANPDMTYSNETVSNK
ncbi:hypothetical protein PtA15_1A71 [Puccinia triticina]|uniref:Ig-like domain-containing protein n=1 Tax=Puccinia triticina TaxID=208348 RepID=A0ABY7C771_9BASI|nr:uncharacterized protein PtA15_1A71 [Puccinia triticina]WAQ80733.1 hypothetical protein PtA15_1A71 [Puccinia triticina]